MKERRFLLLSDIHNCHLSWYGMDNDERMADFVRTVTETTAKHHYDAAFVLGDMSLDFWKWNEGGSYLWEPKVSRTAEFMEKYAPALPKPLYLLPGNHEQYGQEDWHRITGQPRQQAVVLDGVLFVMLDTFGGNLDPKEHSDGTYTPADWAFIREALAETPDCPVFLCAHYFDMSRESESFKALLREEGRIAALFEGHDHLSVVTTTGEDAGDRPILHTGHYSYSGLGDNYRQGYRGWRELILRPDGTFRSSYVVPRQPMPADGEDAFIGELEQDVYEGRLP